MMLRSLAVYHQIKMNNAFGSLEVYAETVSMCPSARHVPSHRPHGDLVGLKVKIQDLPSQEKKALKFNIEIAYVPNRKRDSCRDFQHVSGRRWKT